MVVILRQIARSVDGKVRDEGSLIPSKQLVMLSAAARESGSDPTRTSFRSGRHRLQNGGSPQFFCFRCQTAAPDETSASHGYESGGVT